MLDEKTRAFYDSIYGNTGASAAALPFTESLDITSSRPTKTVALSKNVTPLEEKKPWLFREHPILGALAQGVKETVAQPARAARQIGQGLGNAADKAVGDKLHPFFKTVADKLGISHEEAIQAQQDLQGVGAQDGVEKFLKYDGQAIDPTKSIQQGVGQVAQAGAYLATPVVGGAGNLAKQGAVLGFGRAMEKEKGALAVAGETLVTGALSYGLSKAMSAAGSVASKGVNYFKEKINNLMTRTTNLPPVDVKWAQQPENAQMVVNYLDELTKATDSGDLPAVQSNIKEHLLAVGRTVVEKAKTVAEQSYDEGMAPLYKEYSTAITSKPDILSQVDDVLVNTKAKFDINGVFQGLRGKPEDDLLVKEALETINTHSGWNLFGLTELKRKLFVTLDAADEGTVANRVLSKIYGLVDDLQDEATAGATSELNAAYRAFKLDQKQLRPLWSEKVNADSALNFASNLSSRSKTGSAAALKRMEEMAGEAVGSLTKNLRAFRIADLFSQTKPIPGASRFGDDVLREGIKGVTGTLGAVTGGALSGGAGAGAGAVAGYTAGSVLSARISSPRVFGEALLNGALKVSPHMSGPLRQAVGTLFQNPMFQQAIIRSIEGLKDIKK